jgi:MFS family permease
VDPARALTRTPRPMDGNRRIVRGPLASFLLARVSSTLAYQMLTVAVGWQIYALTGKALFLGLVGLVQFLPMFLLTLVVGYTADHFDRRFVSRTCQAIQGAGILVLALGSHGSWIGPGSILAVVFVIGAARAFESPTMQALMPALVSTELFPRAAAWAAGAMETAFIIGPALGGFLYLAGPTVVYAVAGAMAWTAAVAVSLIRLERRPPRREPVSLRSILAGIAFIRSRPVILGAISLDLFAVLLGGATALLPIYAKNILRVGSGGLGVLRSAPSVGALLVSAYLTRRPPAREVGRRMFTAVIIFGAGTIVFALSRSFALSLAALVILGGADIISVVIRQSLVQMGTPDRMRGRVSAVNSMFVGTSNQLGEFESGVTAAWFGTVPAVLVGGIGTIVVALLWMRLFPPLARAETLESAAEETRRGLPGEEPLDSGESQDFRGPGQ